MYCMNMFIKCLFPSRSVIQISHQKGLFPLYSLSVYRHLLSVNFSLQIVHCLHSCTLLIFSFGRNIMICTFATSIFRSPARSPTPVSQHYRILLATHCRLWTYQNLCPSITEFCWQLSDLPTHIHSYFFGNAG